MRSHNAIVAVLVAACGSTTPVQPGAPAPTSVPPPPAVPTCEEAGIILRGPIEASQWEKAGPKREAAIANACKGDRWSQSTITCVASSTNPLECLDALTAAQRASYDAALAKWSKEFGEPEVALPLTCIDALHSPQLLDPPLTDASPQREWELGARQRFLPAMCMDDNWSDEALGCLRDATTEVATGACVMKLDPKVHARLVTVHDLARAIDALRKTPAKLDCAKVAEHHYSDEKTKRDLKSMKPADRKRLVAGVRKTMSDACSNEGWDEETRACMLADGGEENCFGTVRFATSAGQPRPMISIPECGEYARAVSELQRCSAAPPETRKAMQEAFDSVDRSATADGKEALVSACRNAADSIRQVIAAYGC
ncbi:MAG TPA: hypothetical protein VMZ53_18125 [Kofleriaceae bacterium]|nr:hypothetical protein [Kofleriaceae bacterium]